MNNRGTAIIRENTVLREKKEDISIVKFLAPITFLNPRNHLKIAHL